jgi:hypothetical protein
MLVTSHGVSTHCWIYWTRDYIAQIVTVHNNQFSFWCAAWLRLPIKETPTLSKLLVIQLSPSSYRFSPPQHLVFSLCFSFNSRYQVLHPYETIQTIICG